MYHTTFDNEKKQWNGQTTKFDFNPNASVGSSILNSLLANGPRVAQVNLTEKIKMVHGYLTKWHKFQN